MAFDFANCTAGTVTCTQPICTQENRELPWCQLCPKSWHHDPVFSVCPLTLFGVPSRRRVVSIYIYRFRLISIGNPIAEVRRSWCRLMNVANFLLKNNQQTSAKSIRVSKYNEIKRMRSKYYRLRTAMVFGSQWVKNNSALLSMPLFCLLSGATLVILWDWAMDK